MAGLLVIEAIEDCEGAKIGSLDVGAGGWDVKKEVSDIAHVRVESSGHELEGDGARENVSENFGGWEDGKTGLGGG